MSGRCGGAARRGRSPCRARSSRPRRPTASRPPERSRARSRASGDGGRAVPGEPGRKRHAEPTHRDPLRSPRRPSRQVQDPVGDRGRLGLVRDDHDRAAGAAPRSSSSTAAPLSASRLPVGSSASTSSGSLTSARAIANRCCSPPDSSCGRWLGDVAQPKLVDQRRGPSLRRPAALPADASAAARSRRRSAPRSAGTVWKTKPMWRRRVRGERARARPVSASPATQIDPASGESSPPSRCSSVDLPLPERPSTATTSSASTVEADAVEHAAARRGLSPPSS